MTRQWFCMVNVPRYSVIASRLELVIDRLRKYCARPVPVLPACCATQLMAAKVRGVEVSRFGQEPLKSSLGQFDVMIVCGPVTYKAEAVLKRLYERMNQPRWVVAMGACASSGGMYRSYAVVQGVDRLLPVDLYISGCPPRPEALLVGLIRLQEQAQRAILERRRQRPCM